MGAVGGGGGGGGGMSPSKIKNKMISITSGSCFLKTIKITFICSM